MHQEDNILCNICFDIMLTPSKLSCGHQFCCHCLRSIKYKQDMEKITCPLCRSQQQIKGTDKNHEHQIMNNILMNRSDIRVLYGTACTINHYDKNKTDSKPCFILLIGDKIYGDIVWGQGTEHSSYLEEVGRVQGKIQIQQNGNILFQKVKTSYSNTPYQDWKGLLQHKGNGKFETKNSVYYWYGWERKSSGDLFLKLRELKRQVKLNQQGVY